MTLLSLVFAQTSLPDGVTPESWDAITKAVGSAVLLSLGFFARMAWPHITAAFKKDDEEKDDGERHITNDPLRVETVVPFATRRELERVERELKDEFKQRFDDHQKQRSESITHIHKHLESLGKTMLDDMRERHDKLLADIRERDERNFTRFGDQSETLRQHGERLAALEALKGLRQKGTSQHE